MSNTLDYRMVAALLWTATLAPLDVLKERHFTVSDLNNGDHAVPSDFFERISAYLVENKEAIDLFTEVRKVIIAFIKKQESESNPWSGSDHFFQEKQIALIAQIEVEQRLKEFLLSRDNLI